MVFKILWFSGFIAVRLVLEDVLCIGKEGFSTVLEFTHMALWWGSVLLAYMITLTSFSGLAKSTTLKVVRWAVPGICIPPIVDFFLGRDFDYPYPNGDGWDYLHWMVSFMPHYVTTGQKIEIVLMFALTLVLVGRASGLQRGLQTVVLLYVIFSLYAWFPALFGACLPWARAHHDLFAILVLSTVIPFQALHMYRSKVT